MPDVSTHPYADFLNRVQKPSRYVGGEHNETRKDWDAVRCRLCLAFPDVYEVGMSHLGFKILYGLVNAAPDLLAERVYAPWIDMEAELRARNEPLRSLENGKALRDFDVVGFSLQFELTFTNILQMLELGGIALRSEHRDDAAPLVIAGGPTATHPEPLAPFIDAFLIGDGEERTAEIMRTWADARDAGLPRAERLAKLAQLRGVYVPSFYATELEPTTGMHVVTRALPEAALPVERAFVKDLGQYPFPTRSPIANTETVFDRVSVEIARGCTEGCRFCQAGMIYRPVREREPEEIIRVIDTATKDGGYDAASLTCLSTADYSAIAPLVKAVTERLKPRRAKLSVASLRAYGLAEDVLDDLANGSHQGLTFAPEAGTQRMRDVINKNVTEEQLLETARRVFSRKFSNMKLYFMIALPTEEDEDVVGIVDTGARAHAIGKSILGKSARVVVSVSTFVPKPHTPFQWCAMDSHEQIRRKQRLLVERVKGTQISLRMHDSEGSWLEGVMARGDRSVADVVEGAYKRGARFDSWSDQLKLDAWNEAFAEAGVDPKIFLGTLPVDARLPWDHLDVGLEEGFLAREYRKALKSRLSPPCGKVAGTFVHHTNLAEHDADAKRLVCYDCGVACDLGQMKARRGELLVQLGALAPRVREASEEPASEGAPRKRARPAPPVRPDQGAAVKGAHFEKLGRAAYGSHLDLVRLLPRLLRRLEIPVFYSEGFNPKPVMAFSPALPLGVSSLAEYVDLKLIDRPGIDWATLPEQLSVESIDGVRFVSAKLLGAGDPKLSAVIDRATYVAALPRAAMDMLGLRTREELQALFDARVGSATLSVRRDVDGIGKRIDVSKYLRGVRVGLGADVLARAGFVGELVPVELDIDLTPSGSAKPTEAVEALLGSAEVPVRCVRAALVCTRAPILDAQGATRFATPLDLEVLRAAPRAAQAVPHGGESDEASAAVAELPAE